MPVAINNTAKSIIATEIRSSRELQTVDIYRNRDTCFFFIFLSISFNNVTVIRVR